MRSLIIIFFLSFTLSVNAAPQSLLQGKDVVSGASISLPANKVVVVFVSARCPCSNSHVGELTALAKAYPDFKFVGVHSNADENAAMTAAYFAKAALPFPVIQDEHTKIADHFHALKTPHAFILNDKGDILYQGGVTNSSDFPRANRLYLREALEDLKNNRPVRTPLERSLGCVISRG